MMHAGLIDKYRHLRLTLYRKRIEAAVGEKLLLCIAFACFTGLMSRTVIYLPWTPVPITGQTMAVLISGAALGRWGAVSQVIYIGLGCMGVPWFAGGKYGMEAGVGPTSGYLAGFILASFLVGYLLDRYRYARKFPVLLIIMTAANVFVIFGCGLVGLYLWQSAVTGMYPDIHQLLMQGLYPFIPGAIIKTLLAAGIGHAIVPRGG